MSHVAARQRLLQFLDEHVFDPVLRVSPDRVDRREEFEDAQARAARMKARCHACQTAAELRCWCSAVITSSDGWKVDRELDRLGLPTLGALGRHFLALCDELDVTAAESQQLGLV